MDLRDSEELGRRIAAARGYRRELRPDFAKRLGTTDTTLLKWEKGEFSSRYATREQRRQLVRLVIDASGCPAEWFDLAGGEQSLSERVAALEDQVAAARSILLGQPDADEAAETLRVADDAFRQIERSAEPAASPEGETANG
jgi:transcriptional regulator with XRE-family HTH domain